MGRLHTHGSFCDMIEVNCPLANSSPSYLLPALFSSCPSHSATSAPVGRPRASAACHTTNLVPREPHTAPMLPFPAAPGRGEPSPTGHSVHSLWRTACCSHAGSGTPPLSSCTCWAEPASHAGVAASGMGDSTSLPTSFLVARKAQVCEGSARLQLEVQAEAAEARAARSW